MVDRDVVVGQGLLKVAIGYSVAAFERNFDVNRR
jgi:hypothetical protein